MDLILKSVQAFQQSFDLSQTLIASFETSQFADEDEECLDEDDDDADVLEEHGADLDFVRIQTVLVGVTILFRTCL